MSPAQTGLNEGTGWGRPRKAGPRNLLMKKKLRLHYQDSPRTLGGHGVEVSTVLRSLWGHKGGRVLTVRKTQAAVDDACSSLPGVRLLALGLRALRVPVIPLTLSARILPFTGLSGSAGRNHPGDMTGPYFPVYRHHPGGGRRLSCYGRCVVAGSAIEDIRRHLVSSIGRIPCVCSCTSS